MFKEIKDWIFKEIVDENEFIKTSFFDEKLNVYYTPLVESFLATIINGSGVPANFTVNSGEFQYNRLIRSIAAITEGAPAFWFYYTVTDNSFGCLNDIWECDYDFCLSFPLEKFEKVSAEQGGEAFLGLLDRDKSWLLLHVFRPFDSFEISFHGSSSYCAQLNNALFKRESE